LVGTDLAQSNCAGAVPVRAATAALRGRSARARTSLPARTARPRVGGGWGRRAVCFVLAAKIEASSRRQGGGGSTRGGGGAGEGEGWDRDGLAAGSKSLSSSYSAATLGFWASWNTAASAAMRVANALISASSSSDDSTTVCTGLGGAPSPRRTFRGRNLLLAIYDRGVRTRAGIWPLPHRAKPAVTSGKMMPTWNFGFNRGRLSEVSPS
jgi:hypothetical protein